MKNFRLRFGYFLRVLKTLSTQPPQLGPDDFKWVRRVWRDIWLRSS